MSGFILNRGKSFAARYKEYESKPGNKPAGDNQHSQIKGSSSESVDVINCKPVRTVFDERDDEIEIDFGLSRTGSKSAVSGSKVEATRGKRNKKEKPSSKSSKHSKVNMVPKYEAYDSDCDVLDDDISNKSDSDGSIFSDGHSGDSMEPELNITVIDTDQPNPFKERKTEKLTLKLKFNGKFNKFAVDRNDRILKHLSVFYKNLGVSKRTHELVITYNDKVVTFSDTPKSLNLTIVDILEAYTRERSEPHEKISKTKLHRDPNSIEIKVRNNQDGKHDQPLTIHLDKNGIMRKLMEQYAQAKGYNLSDLIFDFDGDHLSGEETPADLEMENGSLIDVRIRNK